MNCNELYRLLEKDDWYIERTKKQYIFAHPTKNGMNESLLRKYKNGLAFASEKQCRKIEAGLHRLGQSLCAASL